jgi:soluble lytic murein transglycosylase-like protein
MSPQVNIAWGTSYYAGLVERYDGNRVKALAAYNAGPSRVSRWLSDSQSGGSVGSTRYLSLKRGSMFKQY